VDKGDERGEKRVENELGRARWGWGGGEQGRKEETTSSEIPARLACRQESAATHGAIECRSNANAAAMGKPQRVLALARASDRIEQLIASLEERREIFILQLGKHYFIAIMKA
jgi:hypothetical protein